ncbi:MAG: carboxypeptidase-like regulatory domain-containing protein [Bacteroidota bacterium]
MKKNFTLCFFLFVCIGAVSAQNKTAKVSGSVLDAASKPIQAVSVSLLKTKDSLLVKIAVTGKDGKYDFENIAAGDYLIAASLVGLEKSLSPAFTVSETNNTIQLAALQMVEIAKGLGEVTVTAKRPFIETKIDKTVVNVDASPTNAGATALEVLEKSPGVMVNNDGIISLVVKQV